MPTAHVRHEIRKLTAADVDVVAPVMARAFWDDPLQQWIFPDAERRLAQLERLFALQIRFSSVPLGESYTDESCACGAFWMPPGHEQPDAAAMEAQPLRAVVGEALDRLRAAYDAMVEAHPHDPHFYLAGLGTDPDRQGTGLGSAAMRPVLDRCDTERIPAYLESTKARNVTFYEHHGFTLLGTIEPRPDGPPLWLMWREPR